MVKASALALELSMTRGHCAGRIASALLADVTLGAAVAAAASSGAR